MRRTDFHFELPRELIAQEPAAVRSASRLLALDGASGAIRDLAFRDLPGAAARRGSAGLQRYPRHPGARVRPEIDRRPHRDPARARREPDDRAGARALQQAAAAAGHDRARRRLPGPHARAGWGPVPAGILRRRPGVLRNARLDAAAAVYRAAGGRGRPRALPDGVRARAGRGRGADRGPAFRRSDSSRPWLRAGSSTRSSRCTSARARFRRCAARRSRST